jgi:hypothetical protein
MYTKNGDLPERVCQSGKISANSVSERGYFFLMEGAEGQAYSPVKGQRRGFVTAHRTFHHMPMITTQL